MKTTEQDSLYDNLENQSFGDLLMKINQEDDKVAKAVANSLGQVEALVKQVLPRMQKGGRLFYLGAGTSGRLGILDASECPPTFGVPHNRVIGIIAGGDGAIRKAVEFAEDDVDLGWKDLQAYNINEMDSVVGIAASGTTPYVIGALKACRAHNILTGSITCNKATQVAAQAEFPIEVIVGPEFVTGSTRMKSGTAQKMVLNMISTSLMIKLGRVAGNKMVDMQLSNNKLVDRGTRMVEAQTGLGRLEAEKYLLNHGSVRAAVKAFEDGK